MPHGNAPPNEPTSVYRYYDALDVLIYVGITKRGTGRNTEHNRHASWWPYVSRQEVEHLDTRPAALRRERELIIRHRPPFNVQHNPDARSLREAYEAFMAADVADESPLEIHRRLGKRLPLAVSFTPGVDGYLLRSFPQHRQYATRVEVDPHQPTRVFDRNGSKIGVVRTRVADTTHLVLRVLNQAVPPGTQAVATISTITLKKPERFRVVSVATDTTLADVRAWKKAA
jgi:predicted GIY-YIG superfamily endonuclease